MTRLWIALFAVALTVSLPVVIPEGNLLLPLPLPLFLPF
jgi:hypothetical protein